MRDYNEFVGTPNLRDRQFLGEEVGLFEKEALSPDVAKGLAGIVAASMGSGLILGHAKEIIGTKPVYHGTRKENRESILRSGLQTKYGGDKQRGSHASNKEKQRAAGRSDLAINISGHQMRDRAKGNVFVATGKQDAMTQAKHNISSAKVDSKPTVIAADIPYERWKNEFVADPDMKVGRSRYDSTADKSVAAKTDKDIPPAELRGGRVRLAEKVKYYLMQNPDYVKNNPKRFLRGLLHAGAGGMLAGYGLKATTDVAKTLKNKK